MATSTKAVVGPLTQAEMNEEGIKTQLTQNDLLEVIVTEKYEAFQQKVNNLRVRAEELAKEWKEYIEKEQQSSLQKLVVTNGLDIDLKAQTLYFENTEHIVTASRKHVGIYDSGVVSLQLKRPTIVKARSKEYVVIDDPYNTGTRSPLLYNNEGVTVYYRVKVSVATGEGKSYRALTTYTFSDIVVSHNSVKAKTIINKMKEHNKEVEAFVKEYKDVDVRYDNILKETRVKMNKRLIVDSAPRLKKKIKEAFMIDLT